MKPKKEKTFQDLINRAYLQNKAMDECDLKFGAMPDSEGDTASRIRTVMFALESALKVGIEKDIDVVFQAIALLDMLHKDLHGSYLYIDESKIKPGDKEAVSKMYSEVAMVLQGIKNSGKLPNFK